MSKGRSGRTPGVGGTRAHLSRGQLRGGRAGDAPGAGGDRGDPQARKRELLRRLRESRNEGLRKQEEAAPAEPASDGRRDPDG